MKGNLCVLGAALLLAVTASSVARADVHMVTNTEDSGPGSLRQCIADAEPGDEIQFDPSLDGQPIVLADHLWIAKDLTITGRGSENTILDGDNKTGVLHIGGERGNRTISGLTVRNGWRWCGITVDGLRWVESVNITDCRITNNVCGVYLGSGSVAIRRCTIDGNSDCGICSATGGSNHHIDDTTISGNGGAGIRLSEVGYQVTMFVHNTTISGNAGRGVEVWGKNYVWLGHSTITGNHEGVSVHGWHLVWPDPNPYYAIARLDGSVVADNDSGDCTTLAGSPISPNWGSSGHNLDSDGSCRLIQPTDQPDTNPVLGPLQDNGGPTLTHAPLEGSPVIDRGGACVVGRTDQLGPWTVRQPITTETDQRGVRRPIDGDQDGVLFCDIGAVEYLPPPIFREVGGDDED